MLDGNPDVYYEYTYWYDYDYLGDYYKGYGYANASDGYYVGQFLELGPNETGHINYYEITAVQYLGFDSGLQGQVYVTSYIDQLGTGSTADMDPKGGSPGHLHNSTLTGYYGYGSSGLGSESGIIHLDGHPYGFDTTTYAVFNHFNQADLVPPT